MRYTIILTPTAKSDMVSLKLSLEQRLTAKTIINSYPWSSLHKTERICVIFAASKKICVEIYGSEPKTDFSSMTIQITATYNIGSMQKMSNPD